MQITAYDQALKRFVRVRPSGRDKVLLQDFIRADLAFGSSSCCPIDE